MSSLKWQALHRRRLFCDPAAASAMPTWGPATLSGAARVRSRAYAAQLFMCGPKLYKRL